ncbi:hypothetical protein H4S08_003093 [Coemansia sp. RSA 1365]|nr:hypothetical protein H4S08_003093 [Coemansia sp. RSA 1365]
METSVVQLDNSNIKPAIPRIGLGTASLSSTYAISKDKKSIKLLNRAIDLGCTLWDTADIYGGGHNEELLSSVLQSRRSEVFLCSKFGIGFKPNESGGRFDYNKCLNSRNGRPSYIRKAVNDSLERLGVDYIDLYYHHCMASDVPVEETIEAMAKLVKAGTIKYIGLSNYSAEAIRRAHKVHPITAVQVEYSACCTKIEYNDVLDTCRKLNITIVAHSPLGRGIMTNEFHSINQLEEGDLRRNISRFTSAYLTRNSKLAQKFNEIAEKRNCTTSQLSLAWVLAQHNNLVVIPGTKDIKHLEENFAAADITLTEEELGNLRSLVDDVNI